jgi:hypothetical protein
MHSQGGQESALGAELVHRRPGHVQVCLSGLRGVFLIEVEVIETRLRAVQHAEADALGRHAYFGIHASVDEDGIHEALGHDGGRRQRHRPLRRRLTVYRTQIESALRIRGAVWKGVGFILVRIEQVARPSPTPGRVLRQDVRRHEALVLDHQRDAHQVRQQSRIHQTYFKVINEDISRGDASIGIQPCYPDRVIVVPHKTGTLVVRIVITPSAGESWEAGYVHETAALPPEGCEPLEWCAITEPGR